MRLARTHHGGHGAAACSRAAERLRRAKEQASTTRMQQAQRTKQRIPFLCGVPAPALIMITVLRDDSNLRDHKNRTLP